MRHSRPFTIAIASDVEMRQTITRMSGVQRQARAGALLLEGAIAGRNCIIVKTGVGAKKAAAAARIIAQRKPALVLIIGAAGAADPRLRVGDIVVADAVQHPAGGFFPCDALKTRTARDTLASAGLRVVAGTCLTVDRFVHRAAEKSALHKRFGAAALDMESAAIARHLYAAAIPLVSVRVISDAARADTADLERLYARRKRAGRAGAAWHYISRPADLFRTVRLMQGLRRASRRIAESIELLAPVL